MPKLSKEAKEVIRGIQRQLGLSDKSVDKILRHVESNSQAEAAATGEEMRRELLKRLREQKERGLKFGRADILEFLGQDEDELPPEFEELLN